MNAGLNKLASSEAIITAGRSEDSSSHPWALLRTLRQHPFRIAGRLVWLGAEFLLAAMDYGVHVSIFRRSSRQEARARWLQRVCGRVLRVFNVRLQSSGPIPERGLLVSNHLGYLDILLLGALAPSVFVAKREVRGWPVFGWFAGRAGTIFIHREKRTDVARATREIGQALDRGQLVVLFPEGTSSGGDAVLPFKSALLEPSASRRSPLMAAALRYAVAEGSVADEVCYWRDMTLGPHLLNLLGKRGVSAWVAFTPVTTLCADRKALARQLRAEVVGLKETLSLRPG